MGKFRRFLEAKNENEDEAFGFEPSEGIDDALFDINSLDTDRFSDSIKVFLESNRVLVRSMTEMFYEPTILKSKKRIRVTSAELLEYLKETPSYYDFPDRTQSTMCSFSHHPEEERANFMFGDNLYYVFPKNGTTFGYGFAADFNLTSYNNVQWKKAYDIGLGDGGHDISRTIKNYISRVFINAAKLADDPELYGLTMKGFTKEHSITIDLMRNVDKVFKENNLFERYSQDAGVMADLHSSILEKLVREIFQNESFVDTIVSYIDLKENGFTTASDVSKITHDSEVWFSDEFLIVHTKMAHEFLEHIRNKYKK